MGSGVAVGNGGCDGERGRSGKGGMGVAVGIWGWRS